MSIQSNYYRVTGQILLEYRSDRHNILMNLNSSDKQPEKYFIYRGLDNVLYYTEMPRYAENSKDYYKNQSLYLKFPDEGRSKYHTFGKDYSVEELMDWEKNPHIKHSLWINTNHNIDDRTADMSISRTNIYYDTLRIYFVRGFTINQTNGIDGISIRVKTTATRKVVDKERSWIEKEDVVLLDFYLSADDYYKIVKHMDTAIYMNSKYYDQYMDVEFPSAYGIALTDNNIKTGSDDCPNIFYAYDLTKDDYDNDDLLVYSLDPNDNVIIEFATVSSGNSVIVENDILDSRSRVASNDILDLSLDSVVSATYIPESSSDYFNVMIYEDSIENAIIYYPTYGDNNSRQELDTVIMGRINSGEIPITANGFYDSDIEIDANINDIDLGGDELYYYDEVKDNVSKWKVYNDIVVSYLYGGDKGTDRAYNESYSRIIDYANSADSGLQFWRTRFVPNAHIIKTLNCRYVSIKYTCRLVNAMRGIEAIRVASLIVKANKYTENICNNLNVRQFKIVNKIEQAAPVSVYQQETIKEKYIRSYYDATNLVAKNIGTDGTAYPQGQMTLKLYRTNNNYLIQLYNINDDNVRIPYDLTGPYKYKLVFPLLDGSKLSLSPNSDSAKQNLGIGTLVFYITAEQAVQIMNMPAENRYFALMTNVSNTAGQETTLYQGKVEWLS